MISGFQLEWSVGNAPAGEDMLQHMAVAFERFGNEVVDFGRYVFPKLAPVLEQAEARQFDARGGGPHGGWAPLSPEYEKVKSLRWPGKPILERTGVLREALTSSSSSSARRDISTDSFDFGTIGVEYASLHQTGTEHMPDRPIFDFGDELESELQRAALDGVREAMKESGAEQYVAEGP